jgi:ABC-type multidrug transport system ATPase subunit
MLKEGGNVLLLDEPTNDLDVNTMRALEEALENFAGCAVVISHDRWFLDRIATHIMGFEGNSEVVWFEGNYSDYEQDYKKRKGADADQPHRIRYRQLTREAVSRKFMQRFEELAEPFGGINCRDIAGVDWHDREAVREYYSSQDSNRKNCIQLVGEAAYALGVLLEEEAARTEKK